MSKIAELQHQLSQLFAAEIKDSHQLMSILTEEHTALSKADPDQITAISSKKINALKSLELHHQQRTQFLTKIGMSPNSKDIDTFIRRLPQKSRFLHINTR